MDKYDAKQSLDKIVKAIEDAQKLGLAVYIKDGKLCVVNTVAYNYQEDHGKNPKEDGFAYAEFDGFGDPI